jgi:ABC-type transporter Mla subunit MlaD
MKLYEIAQAYRSIMAEIEAQEGLLDGIEAQLDDVAEQFADKANAICALIAEADGEAKAYKHEADRLSTLAKAASNRSTRLKDYLSMNVPADGLQTPLFKLSFMKSEAVEVPSDLSPFDSAYIQKKVSYTADKSELKKALKAGEIIPWAVLVTRNNLQIK